MWQKALQILVASLVAMICDGVEDWTRNVPSAVVTISFDLSLMPDDKLCIPVQSVSNDHNYTFCIHHKQFHEHYSVIQTTPNASTEHIIAETQSNCYNSLFFGLYSRYSIFITADNKLHVVGDNTSIATLQLPRSGQYWIDEIDALERVNQSKSKRFDHLASNSNFEVSEQFDLVTHISMKMAKYLSSINLTDINVSGNSTYNHDINHDFAKEVKMVCPKEFNSIMNWSPSMYISNESSMQFLMIKTMIHYLQRFGISKEIIANSTDMIVDMIDIAFEFIQQAIDNLDNTNFRIAFNYPDHHNLSGLIEILNEYETQRGNVELDTSQEVKFTKRELFQMYTSHAFINLTYNQEYVNFKVLSRMIDSVLNGNVERAENRSNYGNYSRDCWMPWCWMNLSRGGGYDYKPGSFPMPCELPCPELVVLPTWFKHNRIDLEHGSMVRLLKNPSQNKFSNYNYILGDTFTVGGGMNVRAGFWAAKDARYILTSTQKCIQEPENDQELEKFSGYNVYAVLPTITDKQPSQTAFVAAMDSAVRQYDGFNEIDEICQETNDKNECMIRGLRKETRIEFNLFYIGKPEYGLCKTYGSIDCAAFEIKQHVVFDHVWPDDKQNQSGINTEYSIIVPSTRHIFGLVKREHECYDRETGKYYTCFEFANELHLRMWMDVYHIGFLGSRIHKRHGNNNDDYLLHKWDTQYHTLLVTQVKGCVDGEDYDYKHALGISWCEYHETCQSDLFWFDKMPHRDLNVFLVTCEILENILYDLLPFFVVVVVCGVIVGWTSHWCYSHLLF